MRKQDYFYEMEKASHLAWPSVLSALAEILLDLGVQDAELMRIPNARNPTRLQRCLLTRCAYDIASATSRADQSAVARILAAVELLNVSTYQLNAVLDLKRGVSSAREQHLQAVFGMLTLEAAHRLARNATSTSDSRDAVDGLFHWANRCVYEGQYMDCNVLSACAGAFSLAPQAFHQKYIERCRLLSGEFMGVAAAAGALSVDAAFPQLDAVQDFGRYLGTAMQIANDMGDLARPDKLAKVYQDQLSDLRNGRVTLPLYLMHARGSKLERRILEDIASTGRSPDATERSILEDHARQVLPEARRASWELCKRAKRALRTLRPSPERTLLSTMASVGKTNKYYAYFRSSLEKRRREAA